MLLTMAMVHVHLWLEVHPLMHGRCMAGPLMIPPLHALTVNGTPWVSFQIQIPVLVLRMYAGGPGLNSDGCGTHCCWC